MTKVTIGDVLFREVAPTVPGPPKGRQIDVIGEARVILLRAFYQGYLLVGVEAFVMGRGTIDRTDVDWDSAGENVTKMDDDEVGYVVEPEECRCFGIFSMQGCPVHDQREKPL